MYDELVKALRVCADGEHCDKCTKWELKQNAGRNACEYAICTEAADAIEELMRRCEQFQYMPPPAWIPVTERLPENDQDVLVMVHWRDYPENMMCYGRKYKTRWYLWNGELGELIKGFDITHWMPLPEPPKEET